MLSEKDVLALQEHQKDLLREAERDRMARRAIAGEEQIGLHRRALAWLEILFITRGRFLQRRYAFGVLQCDGTASLTSSTQDCGCV